MTLLFVNCKNPSSPPTLVIQDIDTETALQKIEVVTDSYSLTKILSNTFSLIKEHSTPLVYLAILCVCV